MKVPQLPQPLLSKPTGQPWPESKQSTIFFNPKQKSLHWRPERVLSVDRPAYEVGSWLESGNLAPGVSPVNSQLVRVPHLLEQTMQFMPSTCFPPGTLPFWLCSGQRVPILWPPSLKSSGAKYLMGFPGQKHHTHVAALLLLGECDPHNRKRAWEACMWIPANTAFPLQSSCASLYHSNES